MFRHGENEHTILNEEEGLKTKTSTHKHRHQKTMSVQQGSNPLQRQQTDEGRR
jgi:hypothetical protein